MFTLLLYIYKVNFVSTRSTYRRWWVSFELIRWHLPKFSDLVEGGGGGVRGGGGGGGGGGVTSYIWHSADVRAEWPPFFSAARYIISPLFSTKSIWLARFFLDSYVKDPTFLTSRYMYMHIFFSLRDLSRLLILFFGIQWIKCYICLTTNNKWVLFHLSRGCLSRVNSVR